MLWKSKEVVITYKLIDIQIFQNLVDPALSIFDVSE